MLLLGICSVHRTLTSGVRMQPKSCPTRALSAIEIARLQRDVRRLVCSAAWFDHCWAQVAARKIRAKGRIDHALDRARLYPPGGAPRPAAHAGRAAADHPTLMQRCAACRSRWYPPQYVRGCGL